MSKPERTKPLNQCHNPAGCTNPCQPGYNFCEPCREFYGMKQHEEERKKAGIPVTGKYRHKLIQVGEAAQTHLRLQENEPMDTSQDQAPGKIRFKSVCQIHGEHDGTTIGRNYNPGLCPKCVAEKKSNNLKAHGAANEKSGIMFEGFRKKFIEKEAKNRGVSIKQLLTIWIDEKIPAEEFKAGYLEDMRKGW